MPRTVTYHAATFNVTYCHVSRRYILCHVLSRITPLHSMSRIVTYHAATFYVTYCHVSHRYILYPVLSRITPLHSMSRIVTNHAGIVLFDFPCGCNHYSFYHVSFLSSTMYMYRSLFPLLYSLMSPRLFSYALLLHRTTCYLCILLPFCGQVVIYIYIASSVTLWSFRNIIRYGVKLMIWK